MEQHAIPQNVSSYQFKLVGDMTLKQFFQLAGGIVIGLLLWSTPLLLIIRLPLAILSVLLGIGLAFLPFEERPLERWIFAFFRAIYSPTIFTWQKGATYRLFQDEPQQSAATPQDAALKDYLTKTGQTSTAPINLDKAEGNFLAKLTTLFNPLSTQASKSSPPASSPKVTEVPSMPPTVNHTDQNTPAFNSVQSLDTKSPVAINQVQKTDPSIIQGVNSSVSSTYVPDVPVSQELKIPTTTPVKIDPTGTKIDTPQQSVAPAPATAVSNPVQPVVMGNEMISTKQAVFSIEAAPPNPPTYPNVVVGQVVDQERRIVEGAIMEIRDSAGRPIRALRSNKVGHFITVTQLDNGHYEIITEKDGYEFTPVNFEATGAIIPPILVQGKRLSPLLTMPEVPVKPAYSIN